MNDRETNMRSTKVTDSAPEKNSDSSNVLARARTGSLCRSFVEALGRDLPDDDALIVEWLAAAQREHNDHLFTNLLFTALAAGRTVDSRILIEGAALLPGDHQKTRANYSFTTSGKKLNTEL